jgi:uncharacterized paraquat-inducible protein A
MSLVNSEHLTATHVKRDAHYYLKDMKPAMKIWNREHSEKSCVKCNRGAYEYEKVCPRCGGKIE